VAHVQQQTGWPLRVADELATTTPPDETELRVLRGLQARTEEAHRART
jgi:glutaconate CoA-transferase, subunit B